MCTPEALIEAFKQTSSPAKEVREKVEDWLSQARSSPTFISSLITVCCGRTVEMNVRMGASVFLKNEIVSRWPTAVFANYSDAHIVTLTEQDRRLLTQNAFHFFESTHFTEALHGVMKSLVSAIFGRSYMDNCAPMEQPIQSRLTSSNANDVLVGLTAFSLLSKKLEMSARNPEKCNFIQILNSAGPLLLNPLKTASNIFANAETCYYCKTVAKTYHSLAGFCITRCEFLVSSQDEFMGLLITIMSTSAPANQSSHMDISNVIKAKKWALRTFTQRIIRYRNGKELDGYKDLEKLYATKFRDTYSVPILNTILAALATGAQATAAGKSTDDPANFIYTDSHLTDMLVYLNSCLHMGLTFTHMKDNISDLIAHIIVPTLEYSQADVEERQDDPDEFCRKLDMHGFNDCEVKDRSLEFIRTLLKLRAKQFVEPVVTYVLNSLESTRAGNQPTGVGTKGSRSRYACLLILSEIASRLNNKKRKLSVENLLYTYIMPDLSTDNPDLFTRGAACRAFGSLFNKDVCEDAKIGNITDLANYQNCVQALIANCSDPEQGVRFEAVRAIPFVLTVESEQMKQFFVQRLPCVIDSLINSVGNPLLTTSSIRSLESLITEYPDAMGAYGVKLIMALMETFINEVNRYEAQSDQDVSEYDLEHYDNHLRASNSIFSSLISLVQVLAESKKYNDTLPEILTLVTPILKFGFTGKGIEHIESTCWLLSILTYEMKPLPIEAWYYFDSIYQCIIGGEMPNKWDGGDEYDGPAFQEYSCFVGILDNFVVNGGDYLFNGVSPYTKMKYIDMYIRMAREAISIKTEFEVQALCVLWFLVDNYADKIHALGGYVESVILLSLEAMNAPQDTLTPSLKDLIARIFLTILLGSPTYFFEYVNRDSRIWQFINEPAHCKHVETKQIFILAMSNLIHKISSGGLTVSPEIAQQIGGPIANQLLLQGVHIMRKRKRIHDEENCEFNYDSEEEIDEEHDANDAWYTGFKSEWADELTDDDEEDFDDSAFLMYELGERMSPTNCLNDMEILLNLINAHPTIFDPILGDSKQSYIHDVIENIKWLTANSANNN